MSTQDISMPSRHQSIAPTSSEFISPALENLYPAGIEPGEFTEIQPAAQKMSAAVPLRATVQDDVADAKGDRDFGGWLILDLFLRQNRWDDFAKLDAKA